MARTFIARLDMGLDSGTKTVLVELGDNPTNFLAWGTMTKVDPIHAVNGNDYAALDIAAVDGIPTDEVEGLGSGGIDPRRVGAFSGRGRSILFRLRSNLFPDGQNLSCAAEIVVLADL